jgi:hypothetical protein
VPKPREHRTQETFEAVHRNGRLDVYAFAESTWGAEPQALSDARVVGEELVAQRLARWTDAPRTTLELTAFGRYWSAHGGYFGFLQSDVPAVVPSRRERDGGDEGGDGDGEMRKELQRLRLDLMRKRLRTFWWGFGFSLLSLAMSVLSLYLAVTGRR